MKKRWIVLLGLLLLIVCVYAKGIRVKPFPADLDKATTMILQSGNTGTRITITDPEEIQNVRDMMEKRFYLTQRMSPRGGWTYRIIFEAENEEILLLWFDWSVKLPPIKSTKPSFVWKRLRASPLRFALLKFFW